jgi:hypothetical protein
MLYPSSKILFRKSLKIDTIVGKKSSLVTYCVSQLLSISLA